jgi:UrcA family protein
MMKTVLFAAAAALATVATTAPVLAKDVAVRYNDLDLASPGGQRALALRIDRAAQRACDFESGRIQTRGAMECYRQAHAKAKAEMAVVLENNRFGG